MSKLLKFIFDIPTQNNRINLGIFVLRVSVGLMMPLGHGLAKLLSYGEKSATFSDDLGIGSALSMALAIFAEFFCSIGIFSGFLTRLAAIALLINMLVAGVIHHAADPWARKELAFVYAVMYLTLLIVGGGKFSIDYLISRKLKIGERKQSDAKP